MIENFGTYLPDVLSAKSHAEEHATMKMSHSGLGQSKDTKGCITRSP